MDTPMDESMEDDCLSIQALDSDDEPIIQHYRPVRRVMNPPPATATDPEPEELPFPDADDDECDYYSFEEVDFEPESVYAQHRILTKWLKPSCADVDMLVLHEYDLLFLTTHFPFNFVQLENQIFRHRGYTERAEMLAQGVHHVIMDTALFIGTLNYFQILIEDITAEKSDAIKAFFVTQLATDKSLYQGFVLPNAKRGVVSMKGCVITVTAFVKLCFGSGIHRISLGRFGQKTPWSEFVNFKNTVFPHCKTFSMDLAFNFPVPQNEQIQDCIPVFCYAKNPSRSSLMFHKLSQKLLYRKLVNWGWVRYKNGPKLLRPFFRLIL
jgi:hypothetical protein